MGGPAGTTPVAAAAGGGGAVPTEQRVTVAHVLSQEMQLFFKTIVDTVRASPASEAAAPAAVSPAFVAPIRAVKSDPSVAQLLPYIVCFIADEVTQNLRNLPLLMRVMMLADALLETKTLFLHPYLHQLLPAVLTCVVGKQLCADPATEDHWTLRDRASHIVAKICKNYATNQQALEGRVVKTLFHALLDPQKPSTTHYGAITCLGLISGPVLELLVRHIRLYYTAILRHRMAAGNNGSVEYKEAIRVWNALFQNAYKYVGSATQAPHSTAATREAVCSAMWNTDTPQGRQLVRTMRSLYAVFKDSLLQSVDVKPPDLAQLLAAQGDDPDFDLDDSDESDGDDSGSDDTDDSDADDAQQQQQVPLQGQQQLQQ